MAEQRRQRFDPPPSFWISLFGAIVVFLVFAWFNAHTQIATLIIAWKRAEVGLLHSFTTRYDALDQALASVPPSRLSLAQLGQLFNFVGGSVNLPAAVTVLLLAVIVFFRAPGKRFRQELDPDGVFRAQGAPFRCAGAYVGRDQPLIEPRPGSPRPNDFALNRREWIESHAWDGRKGFQESLCRQELSRQLGPVWSGPRTAEPHARCMFAAFALHSIRDRADAVSFLGDFAHSLPEGQPGEPIQVPAEIVAKADVILADPSAIKDCIEKAAQHAFQTTALMTVLQYARDKAGVLAPGQFNGLKLIDRRLWYALHSLDMPNPYVEALGARDHWAAERLSESPLHTPAIDRAVETIRSGVSEVRKQPTGRS